MVQYQLTIHYLWDHYCRAVDWENACNACVCELHKKYRNDQGNSSYIRRRDIVRRIGELALNFQVAINDLESLQQTGKRVGEK